MRICQPQKPCGNLPHLQTLAAETGPPPCRRISLKVPYRTDAPQEIQALHLDDKHCALFLGGEVLTEIGLHIKSALSPRTVITCAYANGLIAYVPSEQTYDLGGYEVDGSYHLFIRPAPFTRDVESLIVKRSTQLFQTLH